MELPENFKGDLDVPKEELKLNHRSNGARAFVADHPTLMNKHKKGEGYSFPLGHFKQCDGLRIFISAKYRLARDRFTTWTMTHPTKGFYLTACFPNELILTYEALGNTADPELDVVMRPGQFSASYDNWVLPGSGIVLQFRLEPEKRPETNDVSEKNPPIVLSESRGN